MKIRAIIMVVGLAVVMAGTLTLGAAGYKEVDPRRLAVNLEGYKGEYVKFTDTFSHLEKGNRGRKAYFPQLEKYVCFHTQVAGSCLIDKNSKLIEELLYSLKRGDKVIVYARVNSWNPGRGLRYDIFVKNIKYVSAAKPAQAGKELSKRSIKLTIEDKTYELTEGMTYKIPSPFANKKMNVSFEPAK